MSLLSIRECLLISYPFFHSCSITLKLYLFIYLLLKCDKSAYVSKNTLCVCLQPGISPEVRQKLGEAAVRAAKAVNYVGAGKTLDTLLK